MFICTYFCIHLSIYPSLSPSLWKWLSPKEKHQLNIVAYNAAMASCGSLWLRASSLLSDALALQLQPASRRSALFKVRQRCGGDW